MTQLANITESFVPSLLQSQSGKVPGLGADFESELTASIESVENAAVKEKIDSSSGADAKDAVDSSDTVDSEETVDSGEILAIALVDSQSEAVIPADNKVIAVAFAEAPESASGETCAVEGIDGVALEQIAVEIVETAEKTEMKVEPTAEIDETDDASTAQIIAFTPVVPTETKATTVSSDALLEDAAPAGAVGRPNGEGFEAGKEEQGGLAEGSGSGNEGESQSAGGNQRVSVSGNAVNKDSFSALFDAEGLFEKLQAAHDSEGAAVTVADISEATRDIDGTSVEVEPEAMVIKVQTEARVLETQSASAAKSSSPAFINELGEKVVGIFRNSLGKATIYLDPPELGHLKVDVTVKNNVMKASITVDSIAVKELLDAGLTGLKSALTRHGLNADEINIFFDNSVNGQTFSGDGAGEGRGRGWGRAFGSKISGEEGVSEILLNVSKMDGAVDIFI